MAALPTNPFSTRYTAPGALPFLFDEAPETVDGLLARLRDNAWWGEIVGPHGTGKTTLLVQLLQAATDSGLEVTLVTLRDAQRRLPPGTVLPNAECGVRNAEVRGGAGNLSESSFRIPNSEFRIPPLVAIDGYEQLSLWSRFRLKRYCRRRNLGLLVTAHRAAGLPALYRTRPSAAVARRVIERLLPRETPAPSDDELIHLFDVFHGNMREILFALYDRYEPHGP